MSKILLFLLITFSISVKAQLWQNDFNNASEWISTDLNSGIDQWVISNVAIGGDVDSINSSTAGNGFAQFNSLDQCNGNHQDVVLTYFQTVDISSYELSYLQFVQHYKRKKDTLYVEFSNDGLTWESIRVNQKYWYYQQTENPDTVHISIPSSVQSQPFYLRFKYSGDCGFAWLIDDVKIFEKEQFALTASEKLVQDELSYEEIPICQIDLLESKVRISNFGFDTLFNVNVQIDKYKDGVFDNTFLDIIDTILPESDTTIYSTVLDGTMETYDEFYLFNFKIYSVDLDTVFLTDSISISKTKTVPSKVNQSNYFKSSTADWGLGNMFICNENYCITSSRIYIPNDPNNIGQLLFFATYKFINGNIELYTITSDYQVQSSDLGQWVSSYDWDNYPYFESGDTGIFVVSTYGSEFIFEYSNDKSRSFILNQFFLLDDIGDGRQAKFALVSYGDEFYGCSTCWESINEIGFRTLSIHPNPTTNYIQLDTEYELSEIKILSLDGKLVYSATEVDKNNIPVSFLENGLYIIQAKDEVGNSYVGRFIKE